MKKKQKFFILIVVLIQIAFILGLIILPPIAQALPGEMRVRLARVPLGETLLDIGSTPLPTALPVPENAVTGANIVIPTFVPTKAEQPVSTNIPTATAVSTEPAVAISDVPQVSPTLPPTPTVTPTQIPTIVPLPQQVRLEGVDIIAQGFNNCGPANLTINLNFYGNTTTQAEAAAFLKPNREDRNVSPWQMVDYVNEQTNLRAFVGSGGDLEMLKQLLAAGYPVVIEKGYELPREGWLGHYLTIFGYDDIEQTMVSMDTNLGPWDGSGRIDSYEEIERFWQQFNYTYFIVYPAEKESEVYAILGPDMVETASMWQRAAEKAQATVENQPDNAFAWFNLATSLTRLGEMTGDAAFYENGAAAYDQAFVLGLPPRIVWYQFRPYIAYMKVGRFDDMIALADTTLTTQGGRNVEETYLYKGHALAFLGDVSGAISAYEQALRLNANFYPAQWALDSLN